MIEEVVIAPGQTTELPTCRSILYLGAVRGAALAEPVLLRLDDEPTPGVPLAPGQGSYWPGEGVPEVSIENPSEHYAARIQWSDDSDITRRSVEPESRLLATLTITAQAAAETELFRAALIPEAIHQLDTDWGAPVEVPGAGAQRYILPVGPTKRQTRRTTVAAHNGSGVDLTLKVYGLSWPHIAFGGGLLLDTVVLPAGATDQIDVAVDGFSAIVLTYIEDTIFPAGTILWMLHEGGTFVPYTKAEIDAWRASVTAAEMAFLHGVTSDVQTQIDGKAAVAHALPGAHTFAGLTAGHVLRASGAAAAAFAAIGAADLPTGIDAAKLADGSVSNAELQRLDGVTADIQGQIDARMPLTGGAFSGGVTFAGVAGVLDKASAYLGSGDQAIAFGVTTKVELDTELFDVGGHFDHAVNYRFTAAVAGYYQVSAAARILLLHDGDYFITYLYKNGAEEAQTLIFGSTTDKTYSCALSKLIYLDVDDFVELYVRHDRAGGLNLDAGKTYTFMTVLGPF
jgi:hypothetical protein